MNGGAHAPEQITPCWRLGIDSGSTTTKAVLVGPGGKVAGRMLRPTGANPLQSAEATRDDMRAFMPPTEGNPDITATGYGRALLPWAGKAVTEITCHARGARAIARQARLVVEIGGQDAKAIRLAEDGTVADFAMNDRCAAGTGSFLDRMVQRFAGGADQTSNAWTEISRQLMEDATEPPLAITATCAVFAETEAVGWLARGIKPEKILWAVARAAAERVSLLARQVKGEPPAVLCGGGARNPALAKELARALGFAVETVPWPEYTGALGAALLAGGD